MKNSGRSDARRTGPGQNEAPDHGGTIGGFASAAALADRAFRTYGGSRARVKRVGEAPCGRRGAAAQAWGSP
ncbi:hypothetical protein Slala02_73570 [Streptomyces lavendulae subsp. lavendulae]|nr:hypothetical protein Slala01_72800 [Streptomyces lavendulae subsp. lavendulae]GLX31538.1 hypothetical protein Slala02_73570 [Streptomyces lavendulae subsp. lavendulae]